jgi:hypothetical protein
MTCTCLSQKGWCATDHTTIIHAYEKIEDLLTTDITLLAEVNSLKKQLLEGNYSL